MRKKLLPPLISILLLLIFGGCVKQPETISHTLPAGCKYYSLKSAQCQDMDQMIKSLEPYPVIFIGDHHTQDDMHQKLAELISALSASGTKVILANEWFYPRDKKTLQDFCDNEDNETEFIKKIGWNKRMQWYTYDSFKPIYEAVRQNRGELHGINLSKEERKRISDANVSAMTTREKAFYDSLDLNVSAHQQQVMPFLSHCHAPKENESLQECKERMYRVQVSWDTKMALESYKLSKDLKEDEKLLVFAGSMHMEDKLGIPLRFARLSTLPFISIVPAQKQNINIRHASGDYALLYTAKELLE